MSAFLDPLLPRPCRIERVTHETGAGDVFTWELAPLEGELPGFRPGQFNMLYAFGAGESAISISGDPGDGPLLHTIRAAGRVTRVMRDLSPGDVIGVRGPFGEPWPLDRAEDRDLVVVAGGIGLAPLRPVLLDALRRRQRLRRVLLLYGARTPADMLYRQEIEAWRARPEIEVAVTVDHAAPGWNGSVGVVTRLIERAGFDPERSLALLCGPEVMMRFAGRSLRQRGMPATDIWLSMERNMACGVGWCGHCQLGPLLICRDGPVFPLDRVEPLMGVKQL